jgi:hypothetical protein
MDSFDLDQLFLTRIRTDYRWAVRSGLVVPSKQSWRDFLLGYVHLERRRRGVPPLRTMRPDAA